tara:strand:- start:906 stop:1244 length:339 start_codon:yes stop_codon:yes gene_type:complete
MKKSIYFVIVFIILNGCTQYSSLVGPSITIANSSGNALHTGSLLFSSYEIKKRTGKSPTEHVSTLLVSENKTLNEHKNERECETTHSSPLSEIFFDTLDEIDCYKDPYSILR